MRKLIEMTPESVVVCDNKECDYEIPYTRNELIRYIGKPCPKCGQNLLTIEDYLVHEKTIRYVDFINRWFSWLTFFMKKYPKRTTISVHYHEGNTTIEKRTEQ